MELYIGGRMEFIFAALCAFCVSFVVIRMLKPIAIRAGLVDLPNIRKHHKGEVPLVGGLAIYIGVLTTSMTFFDSSQNLNVYLVTSAMVLFLGMLDDRYELSVRVRIIAQVIASSMLIFGTETYITQLGDILAIGNIELSILGPFVTILAIIGCVTAFNMMDGIDGLAGLLSIIAFTAISYLLSRVQSDWFLLPLLFIAALLAYLIFNLGWPSKSITKIFMGDAGNMLIGLSIVWLFVLGINPQTNAFRPVCALYIIGIPLIDMVAVIYRRKKAGISTVKPGRDHIHHLLQNAGFTSNQTLAIIVVASISFAGVGCGMEVMNVSETVMFVLFLVCFICYLVLLNRLNSISKWLKL